MKIVTNIKRNKNNNRVSIFLDEIYFLSVSEYVLNKNNISIGMKINDFDIDKINFENNLSKAKECALNLLAIRARSSSEIKNKLIKKKFSNELIFNVIEHLKKNKLLDDYEFAKMFANHNLKNKKLGPLAAKNELFKKGIDQSTIEIVVSKIYDNKTKYNIIREIFEKKNKINTKMDKKELNKIINYIRRKGFNWEDIQPVVVKYFEI